MDSADTLPDGRSFRNIDEYKKLIIEDKDQLARNLTEKLIAYSTGAEPTLADKPQIENDRQSSPRQELWIQSIDP